jgi:chemotaxis-related protein WspB
MLLIVCQSEGNRYAINSRSVREVLPRVNLHRLGGSPPWVAGMLICRGNATPVIDLGQLVAGRSCPARLSNRIVVLRAEPSGESRDVGILVEEVGLREIDGQSDTILGKSHGSGALGRLQLDEQGVFQLVDLGRLLSADRRAILFPSTEDLS